MSLIIDREKCLACGLCADFCILDNIRVQTPPCRAACPVGINPQAYSTLTALGRTDDALAMIYRDVPFPRILAYVCQAPCEQACNRRHVDEAVSIRELKRFLVESSRHPDAPVKLGEPTGKRVAVIGAGPAGMMAAVCLRQMGHEVTLLDAHPEPGGMALVGIPRFHLPEQARLADLAILERLGIELRYGVRVGQAVGFKELQAAHDAVLVAVGASMGTRLGVAGEELADVVDGLAFLKKVNMGERPSVGPRVLVIGGGNAAVDSARVALRLGARDVQLACLEPREEMAAFPREIQGALEEGITFNCTWGPERILTEHGRVTGVELKRCLSVWGAGGTFQPVYNPSERLTLFADTLIVAIGQAPDLGFLSEGSLGDLLRGASLRVNAATMETHLRGVFAAGDAVTGPSSVVEAMACGRKAALNIDRYVRGQELVLHRILREKETLPARADFHQAKRHPRARATSIPLERRSRTFEAAEITYDPEVAREESDRCLRCGTAVEYYGECWYCLPCEIECPTQALTLELPYLVR